MSLFSMIEAASFLTMAGSMVHNVIDTRKKQAEADKQNILNYACALVEEGIAYVEAEMRLQKREAATNAGALLKKEDVRVMKDPILVEAFLQKALSPVRQLCEDMATKKIMDGLKEIKEPQLYNGVSRILSDPEKIHKAIAMFLAGRKVGVNDPLKTFFYRGA